MLAREDLGSVGGGTVEEAEFAICPQSNPRGQRYPSVPPPLHLRVLLASLHDCLPLSVRRRGRKVVSAVSFRSLFEVDSYFLKGPRRKETTRSTLCEIHRPIPHHKLPSRCKECLLTCCGSLFSLKARRCKCIKIVVDYATFQMNTHTT